MESWLPFGCENTPSSYLPFLFSSYGYLNILAHMRLQSRLYTFKMRKYGQLYHSLNVFNWSGLFRMTRSARKKNGNMTWSFRLRFLSENEPVVNGRSN